MIFFRRILFYLFIITYLVFCPILILYALGYIFNPQEGQGIVKSGLIYLSTTPPGATIYLGKRKYLNKTPAVIQDLLPGDYFVHLSLKKHQSWAKTIPVEAGKASVLERILLLKDQLKKEILIQNEHFQELIPIPDTRYVILLKGKKAADLFLYDMKSDDLRPIFSPFTFPEGRYLGVHVIEKSPAFVVHLSTEHGERYLWVLPRRKEIWTKDITGLLSGKPEQIQWDSKDKTYLLSVQDGYGDLVDVVHKTSQFKFLNGVRGFGLYDNKVYTLTQNYILERMDYQGIKERIFFDDTFLGKKLFGNMIYQIKVFPADIIIFLSEDGKLAANRPPYDFIDEGVVGTQFDEKSKRLLVWTEQAIGIIDFSKPKNSSELSDVTAKLTWVYKKGTRIDQAFWVYEGSHIIFRDQNKVHLLELETYGKPHLLEILNVKEKSSIDYSEQSGYVYYLNEAGNLLRLELLPRLDIMNLPFPEQKAEKKKIEIGTL